MRVDPTRGIRTAITMCIAISLAACSVSPTNTPFPTHTSITSIPAAPQTATPTATPAPTSTAAVTPTAAPTATPAPTLAPIDWQLAVKSMDAWGLVDLQDPSLPALIQPASDGYRLDPAWMPTRIEYDFKRWGLGNPSLDQQTVLIRPEGMMKGLTPVPIATVTNLLAAIDHLHPILGPVRGNSHVDDFPSWILALTDARNNSVLVFSSGAQNSGSGPWNVLYNGQLYAQYDGSLAAPLNALFPNETVQPEASFTTGPGTPGSVSFATQKWSTQLEMSSSGLQPAVNGFYYFADDEVGVISGIIQGRNALGGYGTLLSGLAAEIQRLALVRPDGREWPCPVQSASEENSASSYPAGPLWKFTCNFPSIEKGQPYLYPFRLQLVTQLGQIVTTSGALKGVWGKPSSAYFNQPPEAIQRALNGSSSARDLLKDHALVGADYLAEIQPQQVLSGTLTGAVQLAGQASISGTTVRYTVWTPFVIQDGQLVRLDLTRQALEQLIQEVSQLGVTQRALQADPWLVLSLWYAEAGAAPEISGLINSHPIAYALDGSQCSGQPAWKSPQPGSPLRAFGLSADWYFDQAVFVLLDGKPVVNNLDLWPSLYSHGRLLSTFIPAQLDALPGKPFERIRVESKSMRNGQPTLSLWIPSELSRVSGEALNDLLMELPAPTSHTLSNIWEFAGVTFMVDPDGSMKIATCSP